MEEGRRRRTTAAAVQDSERVRAHLYERVFRAKPVSGADAVLNVGGHVVESCGALDIYPEHALFVRTNVTSASGRERPPPTGPWGEEGGMEMGVAHAPLVADCDADTGTDQHAAA